LQYGCIPAAFRLGRRKNPTQLLCSYFGNGVLVDPIVSKVTLPDESDRMFYDAALENNAILITGNLKHYPNEKFIMTPTQFLDMHLSIKDRIATATAEADRQNASRKKFKKKLDEPEI